jgi:hypothetical protein
MAINPEWLNQNSLRNYPFKEDASLTPPDIDDVRLPNYVVVDFVLTLAGAGLPDVYLSQITFLGSLLTLVFADGAGTQIATTTVYPDAHTRNSSYDLTGAGVYSDARGKVVIGDLTDLRDDLAEGLYLFDLESAILEATTIRPAIRGARSIQLVTGNSFSEQISGHINFIAGPNVSLTYLPDYNTIRIDALDGSGLNEDCDCTGTGGEENIVRTINGIPTEDAVLVGDGECTEVEVSGNKIIIKDVCTTPCCGCPELEYVTDSLKILEASLGNVNGYANQLAERISNFVSNFVLTIGAGNG